MKHSPDDNINQLLIDTQSVISPVTAYEKSPTALPKVKMSKKRDYGAHARKDCEECPFFLPDLKRLCQPALPATCPIISYYPHVQIELAMKMVKVNGSLRKSLEQSEVEVTKRIRKETSNSLLQQQQQKYELMLAEAAASAEKLHLVNQALTLRLLNQATEIKSLESKVSEARGEIGLIKSFTANTAHDLKSPLNTLVLGIELIRTSEIFASDHAETLDCLESACAFMLSAIDRSIDFSKIGAGIGLTPSNAPFDLLAALNNPIKWMKAALPSDGRKIIILDPLPEGISTVISDKHWFEENLLCLLSNAEKYSSRGTIRIALSLERNKIRVTVEDSGIGISAESKQKLFKQFSRLQNMATGSTGLGLFSLSKRSEAMGGSCGVSDRKDGVQGSVFWFDFPYVVACNAALESGVSIPLSPRLRCLSILVVDDSACLVKCLSKKLTSRGHHVVSACNGADAVEKMVQMAGQLDLVFMDVQMPVMDGIEATKRYRQIEMADGNAKRLPIICSSANSGGGTEELAIAAGMDAFLSKPFTLEELSAAIADVEAK